MKEGIILLGHGSRRGYANEEIRQMADIISKADPAGRYEVAFLSLASPNLAEAIQNLADIMVERIIVMPIFLVTGNHISIDIPEEIEIEKQRHPEIDFVMARHLGLDPAIINLIQERISEAVKAS